MFCIFPIFVFLCFSFFSTVFTFVFCFSSFFQFLEQGCFRQAAGASQDVQRTPKFVVNDDIAQRQPQFHERPRKLEKKEVGRGKKKARNVGPRLDRPHHPNFPHPDRPHPDLCFFFFFMFFVLIGESSRSSSCVQLCTWHLMVLMTPRNIITTVSTNPFEGLSPLTASYLRCNSQLHDS